MNKRPVMRRRLHRVVAAVACAALCLAGIAIWQPMWAFDGLAGIFPGIVWRVNTRQPLVALSFDDGPAPDHDPRLLAILARHKARATFFLIGDRATRFPEAVASLRAAGHEIGNHAFTLRSLAGLSDADFLANLERTEAALGLSGPVKLFRPPGGRISASQTAAARGRGYTVVLGSAYPYDPGHPPVAYIRWVTSKNLAPGTIVILHDGIADPSRMLEALDSILAAGASRNLRFVTIGELLAAADS